MLSINIGTSFNLDLKKPVYVARGHVSAPLVRTRVAAISPGDCEKNFQLLKFIFRQFFGQKRYFLQNINKESVFIN